MGRSKAFGWAIYGSLALTSIGAAQSTLPELQIHLRFARRAAESGHMSALASATQVLAPRRITYAFDPQSVSDAERKAFTEAIAAWEQALDGEVSFEHVPYPLEANLTVIGADRMSLGKQFVAGYTFWSRGLNAEYRPVLKAQILLARQAGKRLISTEARRHAAMHELGHVLGLDDSNRIGDVMGPLDLRRPVTEPTRAEIGTLRQLRREVEELSAIATRTVMSHSIRGGR